MSLHAPDDDPDVIAFPIPATWIQRRARLAGLINEYRQSAMKAQASAGSRVIDQYRLNQ